MNKSLSSTSESSFETLVIATASRLTRGHAKPLQLDSTSALSGSPADSGSTSVVADDDQTIDAQGASRSKAQKADSRNLYPHLYDVNAQSATALLQLQCAINDTASAVDAFSDGNMNEVWSCLALAAAGLNATYQNSLFHKPFSMTVSFCQRALNAPDYASLELSQLFVIQKSLSWLYDNPTLTLDQAAALADDLEKAGWKGSSAEIDILTKEILKHLGYLATQAGPSALESVTAAQASIG